MTRLDVVFPFGQLLKSHTFWHKLGNSFRTYYFTFGQSGPLDLDEVTIIVLFGHFCKHWATFWLKTSGHTGHQHLQIPSIDNQPVAKSPHAREEGAIL